MTMSRIFGAGIIVSAIAFAQSPDTATAHRKAAIALVDSNNRGVAHLACPAEPTPNAAAITRRKQAADAVAPERGRGPAPGRRANSGTSSRSRFLTTSITSARKTTPRGELRPPRALS